MRFAVLHGSSQRERPCGDGLCCASVFMSKWKLFTWARESSRSGHPVEAKTRVLERSSYRRESGYAT
jgi:hypothetical protein